MADVDFHQLATLLLGAWGTLAGADGLKNAGWVVQCWQDTFHIVHWAVTDEGGGVEPRWVQLGLTGEQVGVHAGL